MCFIELRPLGSKNLERKQPKAKRDLAPDPKPSPVSLWFKEMGQLENSLDTIWLEKEVYQRGCGQTPHLGAACLPPYPNPLTNTPANSCHFPKKNDVANMEALKSTAVFVSRRMRDDKCIILSSRENRTRNLSKVIGALSLIKDWYPQMARPHVAFECGQQYNLQKTQPLSLYPYMPCCLLSPLGLTCFGSATGCSFLCPWPYRFKGLVSGTPRRCLEFGTMNGELLALGRQGPRMLNSAVQEAGYTIKK